MANDRWVMVKYAHMGEEQPDQPDNSAVVVPDLPLDWGTPGYAGSVGSGEDLFVGYVLAANTLSYYAHNRMFYSAHQDPIVTEVDPETGHLDCYQWYYHTVYQTYSPGYAGSVENQTGWWCLQSDGYTFEDFPSSFLTDFLSSVGQDTSWATSEVPPSFMPRVTPEHWLDMRLYPITHPDAPFRDWSILCQTYGSRTVDICATAEAAPIPVVAGATYSASFAVGSPGYPMRYTKENIEKGFFSRNYGTAAVGVSWLDSSGAIIRTTIAPAESLVFSDRAEDMQSGYAEWILTDGARTPVVLEEVHIGMDPVSGYLEYDDTLSMYIRREINVARHISFSGRIQPFHSDLVDAVHASFSYSDDTLPIDLVESEVSWLKIPGSESGTGIPPRHGMQASYVVSGSFIAPSGAAGALVFVRLSTVSFTNWDSAGPIDAIPGVSPTYFVTASRFIRNR